jgi:3'-phosphoadenosine 5'-phosphosulfate sulfotransferase (PAPS reductase)/FAD synthetase
MNKDNIRHVLGISGGKDSAALAVYMRDKIPEMEYFFCDTGKELREVYDYINKLEAFLGKKIIRLPNELDGSLNDFDHLLKLNGNFLPSPQARWCTRQMKLEPFEDFIKGSKAVNYVGIRYEESLYRKGYQPLVGNQNYIEVKFPFVEDKIEYNDVLNILNEAGIGVPDYYKWRSRSGCYFCFYQRASEWIGLYENHPDLFKDALEYEKVNNINGTRYTWRQGESLEDMIKPERMKQIKENAQKNREKADKSLKGRPLIERLEESRDLENNKTPCLICHL